MATRKTKDPWRTVRFFLEDDGVFEVMYNALGKVSALRCTCPLFVDKGGCRHTDWVNKNLKDEITPFLTEAALPPPLQWRVDVLENRRVEVI